MKSNVTWKWERGLQVLLAVLMLWAAVSKLANPTAFLGSMYAYELPLPKGLLQLAAVVLPWVELLCGLLLLAGLWKDTALLTVTALFVVFLLATGQAWLRGLDISCGCFNLEVLGLSEKWSGVVRFLESVAFAFCRNLVLTCLAAVLWWRHVNQAPTPAPIPGQ